MPRNRKREYVRSHPHNKLDDTDLAVLRTLVECGVTKTEMGRRLGVYRQHVHRLLKQYGLDATRAGESRDRR